MALFEIIYQFTAKYNCRASEHIRAENKEKAIEQFINNGLCRTKEKIISINELKGF